MRKTTVSEIRLRNMKYVIQIRKYVLIYGQKIRGKEGGCEKAGSESIFAAI